MSFPKELYWNDTSTCIHSGIFSEHSSHPFLVLESHVILRGLEHGADLGVPFSSTRQAWINLGKFLRNFFSLRETLDESVFEKIKEAKEQKMKEITTGVSTVEQKYKFGT